MGDWVGNEKALRFGYWHAKARQGDERRETEDRKQQAGGPTGIEPHVYRSGPKGPARWKNGRSTASPGKGGTHEGLRIYLSGDGPGIDGLRGRPGPGAG